MSYRRNYGGRHADGDPSKLIYKELQLIRMNLCQEVRENISYNNTKGTSDKQDPPSGEPRRDLKQGDDCGKSLPIQKGGNEENWTKETLNEGIYGAKTGRTTLQSKVKQR